MRAKLLQLELEIAHVVGHGAVVGRGLATVIVGGIRLYHSVHGT